jgi:hypothetical protein
MSDAVPAPELVDTPAQESEQVDAVAPVPAPELAAPELAAPELVDTPAQESEQVNAAAPVPVNELVDAVAAPVPAPQLVAAAPVAAEAVLLEDATSPMARLQQKLSSMNLFEGKTQEQIIGIREQVETGLQSFNAIQGACQTMYDAIVATAEIKANGMRFNPEIGRLSDFVDHCKLLISINNANAEDTVEEISKTLKGLSEDSRFQNSSYKLSVNQDKIGDIGTQISLVLRIGEVFNVPVFTVYMMQNVFDNAQLNSEQATQVVASPLTHNLKTIATCSRVDLMLELLLHATQSDPYDDVNVLIAHIINELIVSKFGNSNPNDVISAERAQFFSLIISNNEHVKSIITKSLLIAIIQNPRIMTSEGKRFSDIFPSGQYGQYFGDVAYRATTDPMSQGPIMIPNPNEMAVVHDLEGEAPGSDVNARPILASPEFTSHPLTRTDIIVAALTAANDAMSRDANIVAAGGAAVSYYIKSFMNDMNTGEFGEVIPDSGLDVEALKKGCNNIPMNDIDCFVFGEVSRQFLLLFSLYMLILYANFYERPRQYGVEEAVRRQDIRIQFILSPQSSDNIDLFMYGEHNDDANTKLISKRLKKNPKVQLVTQETKCFSQLSSTLCSGNSCTVDGYYTQPIDLVKKDIDDFLVLYESLYLDLDEEEEKPDLRALLTGQYAANVDNMVSMKTTMLDLVCIFCNEDKALFIRIFMARKNPKDFARLRVFIEIYLLQLLRFKSTDATFLKYKEVLINEIKKLRVMMSELNKNYYLEQGNLAAVRADTAKNLNADRADFLKLLRSIGRKIVLIPDPLNDKVPATFSKETGRNTIGFFKDKRNPQMKYPFKMDQHMFNLYETYRRVTVDVDTEQSIVVHAYDAWLGDVFKEMPFIAKVEQAFREKMGKIIDPKQDPTYFEVGFADMRVKTTEMLKLHNALNEFKFDEETLKGLLKHQRRILPPLRKHIAMFGPPKASYVHKIFNKTETLLPLFPEFIKDLLKTKDPKLIKTIDAPKKYDDAVHEAIGNIVLEWNRHAIDMKGGATRKRKRVCKRNAMTRRRFNKYFNGKRRDTRRKNKANYLKCKHTRRA